MEATETDPYRANQGDQILNGPTVFMPGSLRIVQETVKNARPTKRVELNTPSSRPRKDG